MVDKPKRKQDESKKYIKQDEVKIINVVSKYIQNPTLSEILPAVPSPGADPRVSDF